MRGVLVITGLLVTLAGCRQIRSSEVDTDLIEAHFTVSPANDGTTVVQGELRTGSAYVTLAAGDSLSATAGSDSAVMAESHDFWGAVSFTGTLPMDVPGSVVTITFKRASGAPASATALIPSQFDLAPVVVSDASRSNPIHLVWDSAAKADETMDWDASGDCIDAVSDSISAGAKTVTIDPGRLHDAEGHEGDQCVIAVNVSRRSVGQVGSGFESGSTVNAVRTLSNSLRLGP